MRVLTRVAVPGLLALGLAVGVGAPAYAVEPATALNEAKRAVSVRIDVRIVHLKRWQVRVNNVRLNALCPATTSPWCSHKPTLDKLLADDIQGLTELRRKVWTETKVADVVADGKTMVDDYRVYLLVEPKVRLTIVGDVEDAVARHLQRVHDMLAAVAEKAKADGKDVSVVEAELTSMQGEINSAKGNFAGQVDKLLAIQPGPDGSAIAAEVENVRRALRAARTDLAEAANDGWDARRALEKVNF